MSIAELLFGGPTRVSIGDTNPLVGLIEFDCSLSEKHTGENDVADHPVEFGSVMSDHVRTLPETVEINGLVSDTPIVYLASQFAKSPVNPGLGLPSLTSRTDAAYQKLRELKNNGEIVDIVTSLRSYSSMVISSLSISREVATGKVLDCTVVLREMTTVSALLLGVPIPDDVANNAAAEKAKKDKKKSKPKQKKKATESESALHKLGGLFG